MQTARSRARKHAVNILFEADVRGADPVTLMADRVGSTEHIPVREYTISLVEGVTRHRDRIDDLIAEHSQGWLVSRMPAVDRALLRMAVHEMLWGVDVPYPVAIDDAVHLAKSLSTDESPAFVNGVLDRISRIADHLRAAL